MPSYRKNKKVLTEDESSLRRPKRPLVSPLSPEFKEEIERELEEQERLRRMDFTETDPWRVLRVMSELTNGFGALSKIPPSVTVFGSARLRRDDPLYLQIVETTQHLARAGFGIITGGGPGAMEAANKGAKEGGGVSIGCNIELPFEQHTNKYIDIPVKFHYFFVRKMMFIKYAEAFIIFPGGFGTLDELFEAVTLIQTKKIENFPIILFGRKYWEGLMHWIKTTLMGRGMISLEDALIFQFSDSAEEVVQIVKAAYMNHKTEE